MERKLATLYPPLASQFARDMKTTTHFVAPILAGFSYNSARTPSRLIPHTSLRTPFGNLVLMVLARHPQTT